MQRFSSAFPASRAHLAHHRQQPFALQTQIRQGKQRHDLPGVLGKTAIANLGIAELPLDDPERVFHQRPDGRQQAVERLLLLAQRATGRLLGRRQHRQIAFLLEGVDRPVFLVIPPISQNQSFLAMQAGFHHRDVGDLGCRAFNGMHQAAFGIDADVRLHAEMPLVALLDLRHFRIALLVFILCRTRRRNQRGIDDRTALHRQAFLRQYGIDLGKDRDGQIMLLQQVPKAKNGAFVRHHVFEGIQPSKVPQQRNVVQRLFHRRIRIAKPLLHEVNPQHRAQRYRRATVSLLRVERFDQRFQARPRHNRFHLRQEHRFPGLLARLGQESRLGKAQLLHRFHLFSRHHDNGAIFSNHTA
ncbi:hypothetical protein FERRO_01160 [Ferrovum sp. JA12]|nr:hypothetical protein FERRO_01160 [Ferrovum sp. JA12]